jgi:hypothetical protein
MFERIKRLPFEKILAITSVIVLFFIIGLATYEQIGKADVNVKIRLESNQDPFVTLPQIIPTDSVIKNIRQIRQNEYTMTITTRKSKKALLDFMSTRRGVEDASHIVSP